MCTTSAAAQDHGLPRAYVILVRLTGFEGCVILASQVTAVFT